MTKTILILSILTILTFLLNLTECKMHTTSLSYVYKYEVKPTQEVAEVIFEIQNKNQLLTSSYQQVDKIVDKIQQLALNYCLKYKLNDKICNANVDFIDEETQTLYKVINNGMLFSSFLHKHILKLKVFSAKNIAHLIDEIHKISSDISMVSFDWLPENKDQLYEEAIKLGVQQGFRLCEQINGELQSVIRVEEITDFEVKDFYGEQELQEDEEQEIATQQETEEQLESNKDEKHLIEWKFEVLCKIN